ncbi:lysoplasmalogenase [Virgibacillus necropolis]|uniref:lysoplasmalogenase n=1 Tax=Virgibacillus necropolis TaxID=163877 RepID=UPI00384ED443
MIHIPTNRLPILILAMSLIYIVLVPQEPLGLKLLFKLIPMVLIIIYATRQLPRKKSITHWLILTGLFFCMIGDATLHWFVIGLSAFLIGHVFYMAGFFTQWKFSKIRFAMIIPIVVYGFFMGLKLVDALNRDGNEELLVPVLLYIIVISLMAWSAILTGNKWAILGSLLFVVSDSILSWNMFITQVNYSGLLIMTTYYGAQFLIAHSLGTIATGKS